MSSPSSALTTTCCIAGGGPAGMMLGFLLARKGVDVMVLEKHADFFRDFRGDTIHPSTLELLHELGLMGEFLKLPSKLTKGTATYGGKSYTLADLTHLPTHSKFIALVPQWDFLSFLANHGKAFPSFHLRMNNEVTGLIEEDGQVKGVAAQTPEGPVEIRADLIVAADGRGSTLRACSHLKVEDLGAPIDVLWFRLSKDPNDAEQTLGNIGLGEFLILLNRDDYLQCGYVIAKGRHEELLSEGMESFKARLAGLVPALKDRVHELTDWSQVKKLTVEVNHLLQWFKPGLLCIGDAAHAMSPVGGVGVNLAVQDAVAAANLLAKPLLAKRVSLDLLRAVQHRREFPARMTQKVQVFIHKKFLARLLLGKKPPRMIPMKILNAFPLLQRIPARMIGMGVHPEHIRD